MRFIGSDYDLDVFGEADVVVGGWLGLGGGRGTCRGLVWG